MSGLKILVVGASIAGPTTAYWLARAGAQVTVIERFPELRRGGQAIDIRTCGVSVMRKIPGMEAAVRANPAPQEGISFVRSDGTPYGILRQSGNPDQQTLISEFEIYRGDLSNILYDLTKNNENVQYIFGEQITSLNQGGDEKGPVTVEFMNGTPSEVFDLVVACDGSTSRTRALMLGCRVRDHITSMGAWAAWFSAKRDVLDVGGSLVGHGYSDVGGKVVMIGNDKDKKSRAVFMSFPREGADPTLPFREASAAGTEALKDYVEKQFEGVGWKAADIMPDMREADDFYASEIVEVKVPTHHKGRFVLVGDAGYGSGFTGGGTSMALAGAYMLAGEICESPQDLDKALEGYERRIEPIISVLQKSSAIVPYVMGPQTWWGIWLRNHAFALLTWTGLVDFFQSFLGGAFASTSEFPLPEYKWVR